MMNTLPTDDLTTIAEKYANDFIKELQLDSKVQEKCDFCCLLWSRDYWAERARKAQIDIQQMKEHVNRSPTEAKNLTAFCANSQFLNTVAQVYAKLFSEEEKSCAVKSFTNCPFVDKREHLLRKGSLASIFITILHKAVSYSMLERHPLDNGLLDEEYVNVYGIDLINFQDLQQSMIDGRFRTLFNVTVKRSRELAGIPS
jgi:hypothetical protein